MNRKQAMAELNDRLNGEKEKLYKELESIFLEHKDDLVNEIHLKIKELDADYPIRILQMQLMRSALYMGEYTLEICGYNGDWYMDEKRVTGHIDIAYLFEPFGQIIEKLKPEISVYMGGVTEYDIRNLVIEYFVLCFVKMAEHVRNDFLFLEHWLVENEISWERPYRVLWGEYRGEVQILSVMDADGKTTQDLEDEIKRGNAKKRGAHIFYSFPKADIEEGKILDEKIAYLNMEGSELKKCQFEKSHLAQCMFKDAKMEWCSLKGSIFYGCNFVNIDGYQLDFENTDISNTSFKGAKIRKGKWNKSVLHNVSFEKCQLEECEFDGAILDTVVFGFSSIEKLDFRNAKIKEIYISPEMVDYVLYTKEQENEIYVLKEDLDEIL